MTNTSVVKDYLHEKRWLAGMFFSDLAAGHVHRSWRTDGLMRLADFADGIAGAADRLPITFHRVIFAVDDLAGWSHDAWVRSGRDWEEGLDAKLPGGVRVRFFLASDGPMTRAERREREEWDCRYNHGCGA